MVVSVMRDMNAKSRRKVLNAAFKQFQRLPDWPRQNTGPEKIDWKLNHLLKPAIRPEDASRSQSLTE